MSGFSLSFKKTVQPSKVVKTTLKHVESEDRDEEPDFVTSIEGTKIKTVRPELETKELVIPLITQNNWRGLERKEGSKFKLKEQTLVSGDKKLDLSSEDAIERLAIQELLQEGEETGVTDREDVVVPLLLRNQVPEGYEEDDNMDVSLRPPEPTLEDYEQIPVEQFGLAMMRGMGWTKDTGIGRTNKGVVEMKEPELRPKGLGLGAQKPSANIDTVRSQSSGKEEKLAFKIGAFAVVTSGSNKGMYGQISSFDEDNCRVILKLAINSKMVDISKFSIQLVSAEEFKTKSKILNNEKYEEYKAYQDDRQNDVTQIRRSRSRSRSASPRRNSRQMRSRSRERRIDSSPQHARNGVGKSRRRSSSTPERRKHRKKSHKKEKKHKKHRRHASSSSSRSPSPKRDHRRNR